MVATHRIQSQTCQLFVLVVARLLAVTQSSTNWVMKGDTIVAAPPPGLANAADQLDEFALPPQVEALLGADALRESDEVNPLGGSFYLETDLYEGTHFKEVYTAFDELMGVQLRRSHPVSDDDGMRLLFDAQGGVERVRHQLEQTLHQLGPLASDSAALWAQLGNAWRAIGDPFRAIQCFRIALYLYPEYVDARLSLGLTLQSVGFLADATFIFEDTIALDPSGPIEYFFLGNVLEERGLSDQAYAAFARAAELDPDFEPLRQQMERIRPMTPWTETLFNATDPIAMIVYSSFALVAIFWCFPAFRCTRLLTTGARARCCSRAARCRWCVSIIACCSQVCKRAERRKGVASQSNAPAAAALAGAPKRGRVGGAKRKK